MMESYNFESDFEDLLEAESDVEDFGEFDEAAPRRGRGRGQVRTAPRGNTSIHRAAPGYATKAEVDALARKLDGRISINSTGIRTLDGRVRAGEAETGKIGTALRKEIEMRKKQTAELQKGLNDARTLAMITPIITASVDPNDKFGKMLPIFMYGGMFDGSGTSSITGGSGDQGNMMMLAMAIALSQP